MKAGNPRAIPCMGCGITDIYKSHKLALVRAPPYPYCSAVGRSGTSAPQPVPGPAGPDAYKRLPAASLGVTIAMRYQEHLREHQKEKA
ncbi:hypothetical protein CNE_1c28930 [Cupriavidus necator N-1]|uniref:Uncharacterized protein n=1 Tax=Cupriavidus necator (strain ATCC 43291 / DSM 13513 / CCUG 52238 / LMG 8453 / N-1) TaxID=1042878 RepID=G0EUF9_CUPNN|nr:hypothetical protein CNE_1c28930 [Cupriavidus necator N-1]